MCSWPCIEAVGKMFRDVAQNNFEFVRLMFCLQTTFHKCLLAWNTK